MPRYYSKPQSRTRASFINEEPTCQDPLLPYLEVPEHRPVRTGLIDIHGNDIWRGPNPIGFGRWS